MTVHGAGLANQQLYRPGMDRRRFLLTSLAGVLIVPLAAEAQQATKVAQIGYLSGPSLSANAARIEAFRQGLRELNYVEGENIIIEWRSTDGKLDRLPALATELVRLKGSAALAGVKARSFRWRTWPSRPPIQPAGRWPSASDIVRR
jgi:hypothetical protein